MIALATSSPKPAWARWLRLLFAGHRRSPTAARRARAAVTRVRRALQVGLFEGAHLADQTGRALHEREREHRAGALAQAQVQIEQRRQPEPLEQPPVRALGADVTGGEVRLDALVALARDEGRHTGDEPIQH